MNFDILCKGLKKVEKLLHYFEVYAIFLTIKIEEDKSMNTFCINSLRRRERRRKRL